MSNYSKRMFKEWKQKVKILLPELAIKFYKSKLNGVYIPYEKEVLLGKVIKYINDPYYSVTDERGNLLCNISIMSLDIILRILVEDLFRFTNTKCNQQSNRNNILNK